MGPLAATTKAAGTGAPMGELICSGAGVASAATAPAMGSGSAATAAAPAAGDAAPRLGGAAAEGASWHTSATLLLLALMSSLC